MQTERQKSAKYLLDVYTLGYEEDRMEYLAEELAAAAEVSPFEGEWIYSILHRDGDEFDYHSTVYELIQAEYNMRDHEVFDLLEPKTKEYLIESVNNGFEGFEPPAIPTFLRVFWDMALYNRNDN